MPLYQYLIAGGGAALIALSLVDGGGASAQSPYVVCRDSLERIPAFMSDLGEHADGLVRIVGYARDSSGDGTEVWSRQQALKAIESTDALALQGDRLLDAVMAQCQTSPDNRRIAAARAGIAIVQQAVAVARSEYLRAAPNGRRTASR